MISFEAIKSNDDINTYIKAADAALLALGYTEHSFRHVSIVSKRCADILREIGKDEREIELSRIAGYMHDIGNVVNRVDHSQSGALMAFRILDKLGMDAESIAKIVTAIGNHDEGTGVPASDISAALIIADKSDVRRSRVRGLSELQLDIHDRVNYSAVGNELVVDKAEKTVTLLIEIDTAISSIMDYFQIFLGRMALCIKAAERLGLAFKLKINGQEFI